MNTRLFRIMLAILMLALATLACGLGADEPTPDEGMLATETEAGVAPPTIAPTTASEEETQPTNTAEPTSIPEVTLDEEYRSEDGGFVFRPVPGYEFEEAFGFASMTAPDGDSDTGPMILMIGEVLDEAASLDELRENQLSTISSEDVQISDPVDIVVDGAPGLSIDIRGTDDGVEIAGRIVVVLVNTTQQLTVLAGAPADRWESELAPIVDAVLASVTFFEPGTGYSDVPGDEPPGGSVALGTEYRSEKGGYLFSQIPDYSLEETDGYTMLMAPGADPQIGPSIFLMGGARGESLTLDELYNEQIQNFNPGDNVVLSPYRDVTVGGIPGRSVDLTGTTNEGVEMNGRVTIVLVTPTQMFLMGGISSPERWDELSAIYESLQASVAFFEPGTSQPESVQPQGEEIRQWAKTAYASSSYDDPDWNASQATGAPDTLVDECEDLPTAWASYDSDTVEWLELTYETPVIPTEINIIQTHSPDQVVKVELIDRAGLYQEIYTGVPVDHWMECPFTLSIPVDVDYAVGGLKITIDQSVIASPWNEIDAVELVGYPVDESATSPRNGGETSTPVEGSLYLQDPLLSSDGAGDVNDRLLELGYEICKLSNFYTAQTESAVMQFQKVNGLTVDGIIGSETWEQLFSDNALPAPRPPVGDGPVYQISSGVRWGHAAYDGDHLWILMEGSRFLTAFTIDQQEEPVQVGTFLLGALPGEIEGYYPRALAYDGTYLWVASWGTETILQAYDTDVDPEAGALAPQLPASIRIAEAAGVNGLTYDGEKLWLSFDGEDYFFGLVSIDPQSGAVGPVIELGGEAPPTPAFDGEQLWVPGGGYFESWAIRPVDPTSGEVGDPLGVCGTKVVYASTYLWVAKENEIRVVDPHSGESVFTLPFEDDRVNSMLFSGAGVWVLFAEGDLAYYPLQ